MPRSRNKVASHRRKKALLRKAKGFWGRRKNVYKIAVHHVEKGMQYAYRDRRVKKRTFRQLWITRINAAAREHGVTYSRLIDGLNKHNIDINRKILADLAVSNPDAFAKIVKHAVGK
ncbi:MAG: 50S ribosomal protein L20 [Chlorobi bacterium]|nr:50S ribosomal protein L20 [Chlorobiota bacterium]